MSAAGTSAIRNAIRHFQPSKQESWWIDDDACWRPVTEAANDIDNQDPFGSSYLRRIAYHQLGLVRITVCIDRTIVSWNLERAADRGLDSALDHLMKSDHQSPVKLCYFHGGWCSETYDSAAQAIRRIIELRSCKQTIPQSGIFFREHDPELIRKAKPLIRDSHLCWEKGQLADQTKPDLSLYQQTFVLDPSGNDIEIEHVGRKTLMASLLGEGWRRTCKGRRLSEKHGDDAFEKEISKPYWTVFESMKPYYDHVRALVCLEDTDPNWLTYQRVILPLFKFGWRDPKLAVFIQPTQNINISAVNPVD